MPVSYRGHNWFLIMHKIILKEVKENLIHITTKTLIKSEALGSSLLIHFTVGY